MGNSPIVNRINALLAEKGISKQEFYEACGITSASYSLWNTGKTTPRRKNLETIAAFLNTNADYLSTGLGDKEKSPTLKSERKVGSDDFTYAMQNEYEHLTAEDVQAIRMLAEILDNARKVKSEKSE